MWLMEMGLSKFQSTWKELWFKALLQTDNAKSDSSSKKCKSNERRRRRRGVSEWLDVLPWPSTVLKFGRVCCATEGDGQARNRPDNAIAFASRRRTRMTTIRVMEIDACWLIFRKQATHAQRNATTYHSERHPPPGETIDNDNPHNTYMTFVLVLFMGLPALYYGTSWVCSKCVVKTVGCGTIKLIKLKRTQS